MQRLLLRFAGTVVRTAEIGMVVVLMFVATMGSVPGAHAQDLPAWAQSEETQKASGSQFGNLGSDLEQLYDQYQRFQKSKAAGKTFKPTLSRMPVQEGLVTIDFLARDGQASVLMNELRAMGAEHLARSGRLISGKFPIAALAEATELPSLHSANPAYMVSASGSVTSQGDAAMRADDARSNSGEDGSGVQVGVLSDSYNQNSGASTTASDDTSSGDLPSSDQITILEDLGPASDEGRAMMQIVHDVAPGAKLAFHTALGGQANFAEGIRDLAAAGSGVITDDIIYFAEPMFQDGVIADAVEDVGGDGVAYFSAVGNNFGNSHQDTFTDSNIGFLGPNGGSLHDFGGGDIFQEVTIPQGATVTFSFQWVDPYASVSSAGTGADTDLNLYLIAQDSSLVARSDLQNEGGDPIEVLTIENDGSVDADNDGSGDTTFSLMIECTTGCTGTEKPDEMRYVFFGSGVTVNEHKNGGPTSYGHTQAENSHSVAAAAYFDTPEFGTSPPEVEPFSSEGGIPIYFDDDGNRLSSSKTLRVPAVTGPDGGNTTFFGQDIDRTSDPESDTDPNFFGTSAAAPHVAGVAALMRSKDPTLTLSQLYTELENTAIDMNTSGYDRRTGYGFVQADDAVANVSSGTDPDVPTGLTATPSGQNQITLNWASNADLTTSDEYDVHRSTTSRFTPDSGNLLKTVSHTGGGEEYVDDGSGNLAFPSEGVMYYYKIRAVDNGVKSPKVGYGEAVATLSPEMVTAAVSRSFGAGSRAQDYRLVALPGQVSQKDLLIGDVVGGDAGTDWRAYRDDGSSSDFLVEYDGSTDFKFEAGNGFWLISTQDWSVNKDIQTVSLQNGAAEIPSGTQTLRDGWNIISNPLDQDVDWTAVEAANDTDLQPLWAFNESFVRASTLASAASGVAYYFFNPSGSQGLDKLKIPYPGSAKRATSLNSKTEESLLKLRAELKGGDGVYSTVQIGVGDKEKAVVAPPGRFDAVSLRIVDQDSGAVRASRLMAERRRIDGDGETFDLQLTTHADAAVELTATNLAAVRGQSVALLDLSAGTTYDLTSGESVTVETGDDGSDLKLLLGTERYVASKAEDIGPSALTLNAYPNPVRDQGTVEYELPEASKVRLSVYDLLGRRVTTLVRGLKKAGRYTVTLNASRLTSGVYFARLRAGGTTRTQKIVVLK